MIKLPINELAAMPSWAKAALAGAGLFVAWRLYERGLSGFTSEVVGGAVGAAGDVVEGAVKGIGGAIGIPDTDAANCKAALELGKTFEASLFCPASTFVKETGKAVVKTVDGAIAGTVKTVGKAVGIPDTDLKRCTAAKAAGNKTDASKYCTAGDFLKWLGGFDTPPPTGGSWSSGGASGTWTENWINEKNGTLGPKEVVPVAGIRG